MKLKKAAAQEGTFRLIAIVAGVASVGVLAAALMFGQTEEGAGKPAAPQAAAGAAQRPDGMQKVAADAQSVAAASELQKKGIRVPEDSPAARDPVPPTDPLKPHEALCISAEDLLEFQSRSDGYISGVNPEWTWSHAAWASSALPFYKNQPGWVQEQFKWLRDVPEEKWTYLMPWYVVGTFDDEKEPAQAEIGEMSVQYYSKAQQRWVPMGANMTASGGVYEKGSTGAGKPQASTGQIVDLKPGNFAHGWFSFVELPKLKDLQAISVAVRVRSKNGTMLLVEAGADFYPKDWKERLGDGPLMPGLGTSAPRAVGREWKTIVFTTLSTQTHDGSGISPEALRKNRPHCP